MKKPNLFIVGEPKTGTGSLYYYLKQHPNIFMSKVKETDHFMTDLVRESDNFHKKRRFFNFYRNKDDYLDLFKNAKNEKYLGEASTMYLYSKEAAKNIFKFNPNSKIIMLFRNPVDFIYSYHSQQIVGLNENVKDFEKAIELERLRKKGKCIPKRTQYPSILYYSELIKYTEQVQRYVKLFPRKNIKIIISEKMFKDTLKTYTEILNFLGLKKFIPQIKVKNKNRIIRFVLIKKIIGTSFVQEKIKRIIPNNISKKIGHFFYVLTTQTKEREKMDTKKRVKLMKGYKKEVDKFNKFLHKNKMIDNDLDLIKFWGYDKI
jgi:hypothetical protein